MAFIAPVLLVGSARLLRLHSTEAMGVQVSLLLRSFLMSTFAIVVDGVVKNLVEWEENLTGLLKKEPQS